jgi:hypothetical protein
MTDFFGGNAKKAAAEEAPAIEMATPSTDLKGRIVRTEFDFEGTKHAGEGRTIVLELDSFFLIACYVPNSGQNLERLDYRINEWFVYICIILTIVPPFHLGYLYFTGSPT